jgi:hypothetical protein
MASALRCGAGRPALLSTLALWWDDNPSQS